MGQGPACTTVTGTLRPSSSYTRVMPIFFPSIAAITGDTFSVAERHKNQWHAITAHVPDDVKRGFRTSADARVLYGPARQARILMKTPAGTTSRLSASTVRAV